jgi:hypothetical protein
VKNVNSAPHKPHFTASLSSCHLGGYCKGIPNTLTDFDGAMFTASGEEAGGVVAMCGVGMYGVEDVR